MSSGVERARQMNRQLFARVLWWALVALGPGPWSGCSRQPCLEDLDSDPTYDLTDELTMEECASIRALRLPPALPRSAGNVHADDEQAARLGFALFYDARLSSNRDVRCASCHEPERAFADGEPTSVGLGRVARNSPTLLNAAWLSWQLWDGGADSVWSQPILALEDPREMNFSRVELAHAVSAHYGAAYEASFGPLPPLGDEARFPRAGRPGEPAYEAMVAADKLAIDRVVANVGKALEAYVRRLAARESPLDAFLDGDNEALSGPAREGLVVFARRGCPACHAGPLLTDERFHDVGLSPGGGDEGRAAGLARLSRSPFRAGGPHSDDVQAKATPAVTAADVGAFRTPSLRNVALTSPYGHAGSFATLDEVIAAHSDIARESDDMKALCEFLDALNGRYPDPPWNTWPDR